MASLLEVDNLGATMVRLRCSTASLLELKRAAYGAPRRQWRGKTTTLRAISGLVKTTGNIRFELPDRRPQNGRYLPAGSRTCRTAGEHSGNLPSRKIFALVLIRDAMGQRPRRFRHRLRLFSEIETAAPATSWNSLGRRAADACDRPRTYDAPEVIFAR